MKLQATPLLWGMRVLVVEDHVLSAKLLQSVLNLAGCEVEIAEDAGSAAVALLEGTRPNVVLLDLDLPKVSGLSLARFLRGLPTLRDVPIIAVSAARAGLDETAALEAGCDGFVLKPIDIHSFPAYVASYLRCEQ